MIRDRRRALVAFAMSVPLAAGLGFVSLLALYVAGLRCDESCYGHGWHSDPDAWQWTAQLGLVGGAWVAAVVMVRLWYLRRARPAAAAGLAALALVAGWFELLSR